MNVEKLGPYRVIDLSKHIDPATSTRRCRVERYFQQSSKDYHTNLDIESHLGTHVETPYHYNDAWKDILGLPVTAFMGRAVLLRLACTPRAPITKAMLEQAAGGRVRAGDIVVLDSPYHCEPFTNAPNDQRPYLCGESGEWFVAKQVKCVGFGDGVAIEYSVKTACEIHAVVMPRDIMFLEVMKNLDQLRSDVFFLICQPMPIKGLDSCCVRAVAIEGIPGFCA
ncbi:MAG: cyclase family protein [Kiritimatiellaeota bacterium]|nr:cyclase family protein [Kiritimatiellota bacterium]